MSFQDDFLRNALTSRFSHLQTGHRVYEPGRSTPYEASPVHRLHLILNGRLEYVIGDRSCMLEAGDQSLSIAWSRRRWQIPGDEPCELVFVAFGTVKSFALSPGLFARHLNAEDFATEREVFRRLHQRHDDYIEQADELWAEGEIKGSLARFLRGPFHFTPAETAGALLAVHPQIRRAQEALMTHYADPDALRRLSKAVRVTPNYLRRLFQTETGMSPGEFLLRVRMQRARYLLQKTTLSVKEIAARVGFRDALHFSRRYAGFWNVPPSSDRASPPRDAATPTSRAGMTRPA